MSAEEKAARKEARSLEAAKAKLALAHANSLHSWHQEALGWVCTRCLSYVDSRVSESMLAKGGCRPSEALRYLRLNPLDHDLYSARIVSSHKLHGGGKNVRASSTTDILIFCQTCGLYTEELLRLLKKPCDGPPIITRRSQNLAKISRLLHPSDKLRALETVRPLGTCQKFLDSRKRNASAIAPDPVPPGPQQFGIPTRRLRAKTHIAATFPAFGGSARGLCLGGPSSVNLTSTDACSDVLLGHGGSLDHLFQIPKGGAETGGGASIPTGPLHVLASVGGYEVPPGTTVGCFGLSSSSSCGDGATAVASRKIPLGGAFASAFECKALEPILLVASCHSAADADAAMEGLSSPASSGDGTTAVASRKTPLGGAFASALECKAVEPNFLVAASCHSAADAEAARGGFPSSASSGEGATAVASRKIPLGGAVASAFECKAVEPNFLVAASCYSAADAEAAMGGLSSSAFSGDGATNVASRKIPLGGAAASAFECKAAEPNFLVAASCLSAADAGAAMGGQGCLDCPEFRDEFGMFDVDDV